MSREYTPDIVAKSFIKLYYQVLSTNPSELYKFYMDNSHFMHTETQQPGISVTGLENIRVAVNQLRLRRARVDLSNGSIDAQRTPATVSPSANGAANNSGGVMVVVSGQYTPPPPFDGSKVRLSEQRISLPLLQSESQQQQLVPGTSMEVEPSTGSDVNSTSGSTSLPVEYFTCPFVQTFFLACQPGQRGSSPSYYVSNSVFRLLHLSPPQIMPASAQTTLTKRDNEQQVAVSTPSCAVTKATSTTLINTTEPNSVSPAVTSVDNNAEMQSKQQSQTGGVAFESEISSADAAEAAVHALLQEDSPAADAAGSSGQAVSSSDAPPDKNKIQKSAPESALPSEPAVPRSYSDIVKKLAGGNDSTISSSVPVPVSSTPVSAPTRNTPTATQYGHSVCVKSIPDQTAVDELTTLFSTFGNIVQIDYNPPRTFCFIKFDSLNSMRSALAAAATQPRTLTIRGSQLRVEERIVGGGYKDRNFKDRNRDRDRGGGRGGRKDGSQHHG